MAPFGTDGQEKEEEVEAQEPFEKTENNIQAGPASEEIKEPGDTGDISS